MKIVILTLPSHNRTWVERCQNLINKFNLPGKNKQLGTFRDDIYSGMKIPGGLLPYFHFLIKFCICRTVPKWNCVNMSQISNIKKQLGIVLSKMGQKRCIYKCSSCIQFQTNSTLFLFYIHAKWPNSVSPPSIVAQPPSDMEILCQIWEEIWEAGEARNLVSR